MEELEYLPLNNSLWSQLGTFNNTPNHTPLILRNLIEEPVSPENPAINELTNAIFHQYSVGDAAYFVFPYLIDIHNKYATVTPHFLFLAANIAISTNIEHVDLPDKFKQAFIKTLFDFEKIAVSNILAVDPSFGDLYNACKTALAFSRHCCGKLLMDILEREGTKRTSLICPQCQSQVRIMLFEDGAVVIESGKEIKPPEPPVQITKPKLNPLLQRDPNPWLSIENFLTYDSDEIQLSEEEGQHLKTAAQVCNAGLSTKVPSEGAFTLIGSIMLRHGYINSAHRFFHLWDTVSCPNCKFKFIAATRWWGCVH